jgi:hypothetical protein
MRLPPPEARLAEAFEARAGAPRPEPGYTIRDTPAVRARVDGDLRLCVREVRRADPALRSLVLTGGFARGEGAVKGGAPQNDYDLVAVRGLGAPREPYPAVRARLEASLGLHVDLQPVWAGRLRWVRPSIFWYETARRGRVLWGEGVLARIPVRAAEQLDPCEGLRLLVNRAAGLLLALPDAEPDLLRLQASKALLAALDAHLLALGGFAPSQRERWAVFEGLLDLRRAPPALEGQAEWLGWAFEAKVEPDRARQPNGEEAWRAGAAALLAAVPAALRHAGLRDLGAYARRSAWIDDLVFRLHGAPLAPGARRLARHPTGRVRVATLRLLEDVLRGEGASPRARADLGRVTRARGEPVELLRQLRRATLQ